MYNEENCRFLKTHEWACKEGENAVVGISNHAQEEISDIVFVDLPKVGRVVKAGILPAQDAEGFAVMDSGGLTACQDSHAGPFDLRSHKVQSAAGLHRPVCIDDAEHPVRDFLHLNDHALKDSG